MRTRDIVAALGLTPTNQRPGMVAAKCPRCRRPVLVAPRNIMRPCQLCTDTGLGYRFGDLLLMVEFRLTPKAYWARIERFGPPWVSPKEWLTPRARLRKLITRPADTDE